VSDRNKKALWLGAGVLMLVAGAATVSYVTYVETRQRERDRHALLRHVSEMEKPIRASDERIWLHVETRHDPGHATAAQEAADRQMLADFQRLGQLQDFAMKDVQVEIAGDTAVVRYRIQGTPGPRQQTDLQGHFHSPPPAPVSVPAGGEIVFARGPRGWVMTGHRLLEQR
jgi:hypothetical protein